MRKVEFASNTSIKPCPKCGNNTDFVARSKQVGEDVCNTWVECKCGFDPTENRDSYRFESIWGGTDKHYVSAAIGVWNQMLASAAR